MGRKGSWFSAIKRVFTSNSKDKLPYEIEKKSSHEKKARRRLKHGESISFSPLFREPSSIEKILGEVDQQLLFIGHPTPVDRPTTPQPSFSGPPASPRVTSHRAESPRAVSPRNSSPRVVHRRTEISYRPEPTLRNRHLSATIIQAAYRGYMARRSFRALRGLVRLQGAVRGQNAKRQTINAMKQMQLFVRVQTQIQWRRIQTLENQTPERQTFKNVKEVVIGNGHWDDSLITKEKKEARLQKKMEAIIKRERAMAYAYSHKLWNATPKSAQNTLTDIRSGGYPWWWNSLDRQVPSNEPTKPPKFTPTPPRSNLYNKTSRSKAGSPYPMKDSDSLTSCPPVPVPNYMSLTVSAKAKVRPTGNPKDKLISTAASETSSNRRFSFPLTQNIGSSFKWNKNSASKDSTTSQAKRVLEKHKSPRSIGNMSIDSTISMPAAFGRKPFNRFV